MQQKGPHPGRIYILVSVCPETESCGEGLSPSQPSKARREMGLVPPALMGRRGGGNVSWESQLSFNPGLTLKCFISAEGAHPRHV